MSRFAALPFYLFFLKKLIKINITKAGKNMIIAFMCPLSLPDAP